MANTFEGRAEAYVSQLERDLGPKLATSGKLEINLKPPEIEWVLAVTVLRLAETRKVLTRAGEIGIKVGVPFAEAKIEEKILKVKTEIALLEPLNNIFVPFSYSLASDSSGKLELVGGKLSAYEEKVPFFSKLAFGALGVDIKQVIALWLSDPTLALEESFAKGLHLGGGRLKIETRIESWGVVAKIIYT